jgi:hypothetical protein
MTGEIRDIVHDVPPDLISFIGMEHEQVLRTLRIDPEDMHFVDHIQGLYAAAMTRIRPKQLADLIVFQLLTFTHYHFLFSTACFTRCHLAEAFNSLRCAIDGAFVAAHIIHDRASQTAYRERKKPFDKLLRHYRNLVRDRPDRLPHAFIPHLIERHDLCSRYASHADADVFAHRSRVVAEDGNQDAYVTVEYFQFARDKTERRLEFLWLLNTFTIVLSVFASFLHDEQGVVPEAWMRELQGLGAETERVRDELTPDEPSVET